MKRSSPPPPKTASYSSAHQAAAAATSTRPGSKPGASPFVYVDIADEKHSTLIWHVVRKARPGYRGSVGIPVIDTGDEVLIAPKYNDLQDRFAPKT